MTLNQMQRGTGKERKAVTEKKNKLTKKKPGEEAENEVDGYTATQLHQRSEVLHVRHNRSRLNRLGKTVSKGNGRRAPLNQARRQKTMVIIA